MMIEGYLTFPCGFAIEPDMLGKQLKISVNGFKGHFAIPRLKAQKNGWDILIQPKNTKWKYKNFNWGSVFKSPSGHSYINACSIFFDVDEINQVEIIGQEIREALPQWRNLFLDNLSAYGNADCRDPERSKTIVINDGNKLGLLNPLTSERFLSSKIPEFHLKINTDGRYMKQDDLQTILDATSKGYRPHLSYYLLIDAERALENDDYRKAILDSATALEVCYTEIIESLLPVPDNVKDYILQNIQALNKRGEIIERFGQLPYKNSDYAKQLYSIRNKVIHEGEKFSRKEANTAFNLVRDTLNHLLPDKFIKP